MSKEFEVEGFKPGVLVAGADLSAHQHKAVMLDTAGAVVLATAGALVLGILKNAPVLGEACEIDFSGISKAVIGAGVTNAGTKLASNGSGLLITAVSTNHVAAILLVPGVASGDKASVKIIGLSGQVLA